MIAKTVEDPRQLVPMMTQQTVETSAMVSGQDLLGIGRADSRHRIAELNASLEQVDAVIKLQALDGKQLPR